MTINKTIAKIMYLEDELDALCTMMEFLNLRHFAVIKASSYDEGLKGLKKYKPQLILVDLKLGDKSGLDFIRKIRADGDQTPVIVITAYPEKMAEVTLKDLHIHALFIKPFSYEKLYKMLKEIFEIR